MDDQHDFLDKSKDELVKLWREAIASGDKIRGRLIHDHLVSSHGFSADSAPDAPEAPAEPETPAEAPVEAPVETPPAEVPPVETTDAPAPAETAAV